jgi:hypothetical protein
MNNLMQRPQNSSTIIPMKTLTLTINDDLEQRLQKIADRQGKAPLEVVREALEAFTNPVIPSWVGIGTSEDGDLSTRDEEILSQEWR